MNYNFDPLAFLTS